jgi:hypothetical protein
MGYFKWRRTSNREIEFIHVPKTGGTFMGQFETANIPIIGPAM